MRKNRKPRPMTATWEEFARQVTAAGLIPHACVLDPKPGQVAHWQIKGGACVVNYYPTRGSIWTNRHGSKFHGTVSDAISAALDRSPACEHRRNSPRLLSMPVWDDFNHTAQAAGLQAAQRGNDEWLIIRGGRVVVTFFPLRTTVRSETNRREFRGSIGDAIAVALDMKGHVLPPTGSHNYAEWDRYLQSSGMGERRCQPFEHRTDAEVRRYARSTQHRSR